MNNYEGFKEKILRKTGIDLSLYKERQMKRRIDSLIKRNNFNRYDDYFEALNKNKELFDEFINYLTINVSEFFRNPSQWEVLKQDIFPMILKKTNRPKIWSAACSTGDEPYSLAMALSEHMPLKDIKILATDIDQGALNKAQQGLYSPKSIEQIPKHLKGKFFRKIGENYQIVDEIKNCVQFKKHNLLKDDYPSHCDLIVCRNVMIYFTESCKEIMYKKFYGSLSEEGILFVGSTEQIILPRRYELESFRTFFYKKI